MALLKRFENAEFGQLSVIVKDGKEYMDGIHVATMLGYLNPRDAIVRHCTEAGVVFHDTGVVTGKKADGSDSIQYFKRKYINEGNVYRLIMKSKLPSAQRFEKWVMEEVLPNIRRHGAYMNEDVINQTLENPDFLIELAVKLKEEKERKRLAEEKAKMLENTIAMDKPYTDFGKSLANCEDAITIGQFAKILSNNDIEVGRNRLFSWFRDNGYLIKSGKDKNIPKQSYINQGLFTVEERVVRTLEGEVISTTTLITGKGQLYFMDKFSF